MKHLVALGSAWQLATYIGMNYDNFHVTLSYNERRAELTIFETEREDTNLDVLRDWMLINKVPCDSIELTHVNGGEFRTLDVRWEVK